MHNPASYPAYHGDPTFRGHDCPVCWTPECECGPGYFCKACANYEVQQELERAKAYDGNPRPWSSSCERRYPVGHSMTAAERHELPDEAFGLVHWERALRGGQRRPGRRGRWHKRRDYPMDDVVHARNAKARASRAYNMGRLSRAVRDRVYRKADAILDRCRGVIPMPQRRRRVANPGHGKDELDRVIEATDRHGTESDPEHEVGDLQGLLLRAFEIMGPSQRRRFLGSDEATSLLEEWSDD